MVFNGISVTITPDHFPNLRQGKGERKREEGHRMCTRKERILGGLVPSQTNVS